MSKFSEVIDNVEKFVGLMGIELPYWLSVILILIAVFTLLIYAVKVVVYSARQTKHLGWKFSKWFDANFKVAMKHYHQFRCEISAKRLQRAQIIYKRKVAKLARYVEQNVPAE